MATMQLQMHLNQQTQFGDNMYKTFLYKIADISDLTHTNMTSIYDWVHDFYKIGKLGDRRDHIVSLLEEPHENWKNLGLTDDELKQVATDPIASLIYCTATRSASTALERQKQLLALNPSLTTMYLGSWNMIAYYIAFVLDSNVLNDQKFITDCVKNFFNDTDNALKYLPSFIDLTKYFGADVAKIVDNLLVTAKIDNTRSKAEYVCVKKIVSVLRSNMDIIYQYASFFSDDFKQFIIALKNDIDNKRTSLEDTYDNAGSTATGTKSNSNEQKPDFIDAVIKTSYKALDHTFPNIFSSIFKYPEATPVNQIAIHVSSNLHDAFVAMPNAATYKNTRDILEKNIEDILKQNASGLNQFEQLLHSVCQELQKNFATIVQRSSRMYKSRIVKAYTNYYIKTYLPGLIKKAADNLPQVVTVGTGEVQDIMFNDGKLMEYDNPSVVNQISNDLTEAVNKPDLIPGGAADGMSIEDIARKWAPIYNMDYARILDILKKQLEFGKLVELEHTNNNDMAEEIARDHLTEAADYYSYLEEMEQLFPSQNVAVKPAQEDENFEPEFLENPDKQEEHTCKGDGSCGGACHCNHDIKPQTVEDKIKSLNQLADEGGSIIVTVISDADPTQEETLSNSANDYIMNIAAKIKR